MKKLLFFVLIIFSQNVFCQDYHFDKIIQYNEKNLTLGSDKIITIYLNSKSSSYYFICKDWNNTIDAYLVDKTKKLVHKYYIENIKTAADFNYVNSRKINPSNYNIECETVEIIDNKIDSVTTKIEAIRYYNKKKRIVKFKYETIVIPTTFPILDTLIGILQHHYLFCQEVSVSQNSIPKSIKFSCPKGCDIEQNLISINDYEVNFHVNVDEIKYDD